MRINIKKDKIKYSVPFVGKDYFLSGIQPTHIKASEKKVNYESAIRRHDDVVIAVVTTGTGIIRVNGIERKLKKGDMVCLGPFQNYTFLADKAIEFEIMECSINSGAYLYIIACPYFRYEKFEIPSELKVFELNEKEENTVKELISDMIFENEKEKLRSGQIVFFLTLKLFGIFLTKEYEKAQAELCKSE